METGSYREPGQKNAHSTGHRGRNPGRKAVDFMACRRNNFLLFNLIQTTTTGGRVVVFFDLRKGGNWIRSARCLKLCRRPIISPVWAVMK